MGRPDDPGLAGAAVGLGGPDRVRLSGPPGMEKAGRGCREQKYSAYPSGISGDENCLEPDGDRDT